MSSAKNGKKHGLAGTAAAALPPGVKVVPSPRSAMRRKLLSGPDIQTSGGCHAVQAHRNDERKRPMVEVILVIPADPLGGDYLNAGQYRRFMQIKMQTLGYGHADLRVPEVGSAHLHALEDCAVKNLEDAETLRHALGREFPQNKFDIKREARPGTAVIWYQSRRPTGSD
jgi:hypothetical protein